MKTTTLVLGILALLCVPALAGDDDGEESRSALTAKVARLEAENKHLREAFEKASKNLQVATRSVEALTNSLNAMRELNKAQRPGINTQSKIEKLEEDIKGWHAYYRGLLVEIGKPAVKPLLARLKEDPVGYMPWVCPVFAEIGKDAAEAVPYLESVSANERHQQRGVARYADIALEKIKADK